MKTVKSIHLLIEDIVRKYVKKILSEGIDYDEDTLAISYNPDHEDNVDTGDANPTLDNSILPNVDVWSIFKRRSGTPNDGNPLLYAMKGGEKGWHFATAKDRNAIYARLEKIASKFVALHKYPTTIIVPSTNMLNATIANTIKNKNNDTMVVDDIILKTLKSDIREYILLPGSKFREVYGKNFKNALAQFDRYCERMKTDYFQYHALGRDFIMRDAIDQTMRVNEPRVAAYADNINDKNILLIDDSVSNGNSIREAVRIIRENFAPRTITVLTLFSTLY
jgi:phosphoribosylpyrophosphate synthetase